MREKGPVLWEQKVTAAEPDGGGEGREEPQVGSICRVQPGYPDALGVGESSRVFAGSLHLDLSSSRAHGENISVQEASGQGLLGVP